MSVLVLSESCHVQAYWGFELAVSLEKIWSSEDCMRTWKNIVNLWTTWLSNGLASALLIFHLSVCSLRHQFVTPHLLIFIFSQMFLLASWLYLINDVCFWLAYLGYAYAYVVHGLSQMHYLLIIYRQRESYKYTINYLWRIIQIKTVP